MISTFRRDIMLKTAGVISLPQTACMQRSLHRCSPSPILQDRSFLYYCRSTEKCGRQILLPAAGEGRTPPVDLSLAPDVSMSAAIGKVLHVRSLSWDLAL